MERTDAWETTRVLLCHRESESARNQTETYRGAEYTVDFLPKIKIEAIVADNQSDAAVSAIAEAARTGQIGDGKIFVSNIESVIRIRTGESGEEAL